jgi:hypothetical protein
MLENYMPGLGSAPLHVHPRLAEELLEWGQLLRVPVAEVRPGSSVDEALLKE